MPDFTKTLVDLRAEWEDCERCELGNRRKATGGAFVFGEGLTRGVMFIGEGPGRVEEEKGRPFVGDSGDLLRKTIDKLGLSAYYITNIVCCRSCVHAHDSEGQPMYRYNKRERVNYPVIKDEPPSPTHITACLSRLYEEIYLVDPVLIVTLGLEAAKTLVTGRVITAISSARGNTRSISIPGAWHLASLTPKRQQWRRKSKGEIVQPVEQNYVNYLMLPTFHPAFVLRRFADKSLGNPAEMFLKDMKNAVDIYNRYMMEIYGIHPAERNIELDDLMEED